MMRDVTNIKASIDFTKHERKLDRQVDSWLDMEYENLITSFLKLLKLNNDY